MADEEEQEMYRIHRLIIYSIVMVFEFFGLFGNFNIVFLIYRRKSLRTNFGVLMCFLATVHSLCLLYELVCMSFGIAITYFSCRVPRRFCFYWLFPYTFLHPMQTGTMMVMSLDLLLSIVIPIPYRTCNRKLYFPMVYSPVVFYGSFIVIGGFLFSDEEFLPMCNPPSSLSPSIRFYYYRFMTIFSMATIIFYISAFLLIYLKSKSHRQAINLIEKKALLTLKVLILSFILTRLFSTILTTLLIELNATQSAIRLAQNYAIIPNLICYSQNCYVCYFRSKEYRMLLQDQFDRIVGKKTKKNLMWRSIASRRLQSMI